MKKMMFLGAALFLQVVLIGASHTARQTRPIQLGVSGGSTVDFSNGYCCSGTLGSLVKDSNGIYILSNTHVFAGDTATGGNGKVSTKGDPINQPGFVDINCQKKPADYVATLERWVKLVPNGTTSVDAAIAKTTSNMVNSQGSILAIGPISSTPRAAFVGQKVKKSGRTTGLTTGQVSALNATVSVGYTKECAGTGYVTTFRNQILVTPGSFIRAGDSGSLMVENVATKPRPIGLLFAGSSSIAVANPIQSVLTALQVSMVGTPTTILESTQFEKMTANSFANALAVQEKHGDTYLKIPGVVGHALMSSSKDPQKAAIVFLVEKQSSALTAKLPKMLDGTAVEILEVGVITAY